MFSLKFTKFFIVFAFAPLIFTACRFWQKSGGEVTSPTPFVAEELKSEIPFSTKEPDTFQAEIVVTADESENKMFVARSGNKRRFDYDFESAKQVSTIQTDKFYTLLAGKKIYTEAASGTAAAQENWTDFLTNVWLNQKPDAKFYKQAAENNLTVYRAVFGDAANQKSEALIYVDEALNLPVKQEFYTVSGEQRTLTMSVELKNLKLEASDDLFVVPKDFRKVSSEEFQKVLRKENE
jgi:outer membrane lipoprotein-sorting protein